MNSLGQLRQSYNRAAKPIALDERFRERPSLRIEDKTFWEIFGPIADVFKDGRLYPENRALGIPEMIDEMRTMVLEAHTTSKRGNCTRKDRNKLVNTLQSIKDKAEKGVDANGMRAADMDFFLLPELIDAIHEARDLQDEILDNDDVAKALNEVAKNIEISHNNLWRPKSEASKPAAAQEAIGKISTGSKNVWESDLLPDNDIADKYDPNEGIHAA